MYLFKHEDKLFELIFGESSRLICTKNKIKDDEVKLMREVNGGMALVRKKCQPENEKFSIIGIQIAGKIFLFILFIVLDFLNYYYNNKYYFIGTKIYLNILLRDKFNIHRYYHLLEAQIPIQQTEDVLTTLPKFVELLLNLRVCIIIKLNLII